MKYQLFLIVLLLFVNSSLAQDKLVKPRTEIEDPELKEFMVNLETAVKNHDKDQIIKILSPNIMNGFGGNNGIEEFKQYWNWSEDDPSFWKVMDRLLELGGGMIEQNGTYTIPYVSIAWPETYDVYSHAAITGTKVNLRDQPNLNGSTVLGQLDYDIVKIDYERSHPSFEDPEWYFVESIDGNLKGYVYWKYVWSPIGYRAFFKNIDGEWKMTILLAGD